jgi:hypothetical protein
LFFPVDRKIRSALGPWMGRIVNLGQMLEVEMGITCVEAMLA